MSNELQLVGGAINASTISQALTRTLEKACLDAGSATEAMKAIASKPALLAEAREMLPLVKRLAAGISEIDMYDDMRPLMVLYGKPDFGNQPNAKAANLAWIKIFHEAFADVPREAFQIAVSEWIRVGKSYARKEQPWAGPTPADLYALAKESAEEIRLIAYRLRRAVDEADQYKPPPPPPTAEERAQVREMLADIRKYGLRKPPAPPMPARSQHEIAQEMRAMAANR